MIHLADSSTASTNPLLPSWPEFIIGTILFFPMMFFAGLWLPIAQMPAVLRHISHATPLGAAVPALTAAAEGSWPTGLQLLTMAAWAVAFGLAAARFFRWE